MSQTRIELDTDSHDKTLLQVAEVEALRIRVGELDNKVQFQFQQLNEMREEVRTARAVR